MNKTYNYISKGKKAIIFNCETEKIIAIRRNEFDREVENISTGNCADKELVKFFLQNGFLVTEDLAVYYEKIEQRMDNKILVCSLNEEMTLGELQSELDEILNDCHCINIAILDIGENISAGYAKDVYELLATITKKVNVCISNSAILTFPQWAWLRATGELLIDFFGKEDIYLLQLNISGWNTLISLNVSAANLKDVCHWIDVCEKSNSNYFLNFSPGSNYINKLEGIVNLDDISSLLKACGKPSHRMLLSFYKVPSNRCNSLGNIRQKKSAKSLFSVVEFLKCNNCNTNTMCYQCRYRDLCNYKCKIHNKNRYEKCIVYKLLDKLLFS